jgi:tetratricopeptide (TPR) repeat protein
MNITVPTTTSVIATSTKATPDYLFLNAVLNSNAIVTLIHGLVIITVVWITLSILKPYLAIPIKGLKNILYKSKDREINLDIRDRQEEKNEKLTPIEAEAPTTKELTEPTKKTWENPESIEDWRVNMFISFWSKEFDKADEAYKKIQSLETNPKERKIDTIKYLENRYCYAGDTEALKKLEAMKTDGEIVANAYQAVGWCHEHGENFSQAASEFTEASKLFKTDEERITAKIYASKNILKVSSLESAVDFLTEELKLLTDVDLQFNLYVGIAELYDIKEDQEMKTIILEKALKLKPSDKSILFKVGYSSSELSTAFSNLSLLHYTNSIKFGSEDEAVLNNLGVQYERLGMSLKSISSYKKSSEKGGTLAVANIAYKYLNAGFKDDAKKIIDDVKDKKDVHKNVSEANAALSENNEIENKKEKEFLEEAKKEQGFFAKFTEQYFTPTEIKDYSGEWTLDDGTKVYIEQDADQIKGTWDLKGKKKFTGKIKNSAAKIMNHRMFYSRYLKTVEDEIDYIEDGEGFLFVDNDDKNRIKIMNIKDGKMLFSSLKKVL